MEWLLGFFDWTSDPTAWVALATLVILEIVLGIDNLIFISILTNKLPIEQQARARRLGIGAALVMRLLLLATISFIVQLTEPLFTAFGHGFSWRDLILIGGGLFLLAPESSAVEAPAAAEEGGTYFVPLFRAPSADLNLTLALALITMFMVQFFGVRALGFSYFRKFFTFSGKGYMRFINAFVGILELISEISRIISFSFRLYGNIFAGEIVLATMAFLGAFLLPMPFYMLELFVGFVQALVFTMLALVFFSMATQGHHDDSHAEAHS